MREHWARQESSKEMNVDWQQKEKTECVDVCEMIRKVIALKRKEKEKAMK